MAAPNATMTPPNASSSKSAQTEREPRPCQAHAARSVGATIDRGTRPAARWPRTTSSSVAGRPPGAGPRTRPSRSPAGPGKIPTIVLPPGTTGLAPAEIDHDMLRDGAGDRQVEQGLASTEHEQSVARLLDVGDDMRRQEGGRTIGADGINEHVKELAAGQRVQAGQRLVEQEHRCPHAERERQPDLCLLTARQLLCPRRERDVEIVEPAPGHGHVEPGPERIGQGNVLVDGQLPVQRRRLRHVADPADRRAPVTPRIDAVDGEVALARPLEADPRLEQRRLARAVRADERGDAPVRDREVDVAERPAAPPIALADVMGLQDGHRSLRVAGGPGRPDRLMLRDRCFGDAPLARV